MLFELIHLMIQVLKLIYIYLSAPLTYWQYMKRCFAPLTDPLFLNKPYDTHFPGENYDGSCPVNSVLVLTQLANPKHNNAVLDVGYM